MQTTHNYEAIASEISSFFGEREVTFLGPETQILRSLGRDGSPDITEERKVFNFAVNVEEEARLPLACYMDQPCSPFKRTSSVGNHQTYPQAYTSAHFLILEFPEADIDICMHNLRNNSRGIINKIENSVRDAEYSRRR